MFLSNSYPLVEQSKQWISGPLKGWHLQKLTTRIHKLKMSHTSLPKGKAFLEFRNPTLKLTPDNGWLEYDRFVLGWPISRCQLLVLGQCIYFLIPPSFLKPSEQLTSLAASPCRWYKPCRVPFPWTVPVSFAQVVLEFKGPSRPSIPQCSLKNDAMLDTMFHRFVGWSWTTLFFTTNLKHIGWFMLILNWCAAMC